MGSAITWSTRTLLHGTVTVMARVVGWDASAIWQGDVSSVAYSIVRCRDARSDDIGQATAVEGHVDISVAVTDCIFNSLQQDARWQRDDVGYNFRWTLEVVGNAAFAMAGTYRVMWTLTPRVGQPIRMDFRVEVR